ncbi:MAG: type IV pilin protein [Candidatus Binatia bacterium]
MNRLRVEGGFTLVELLVVIGIIGILAAIAIPQFAAYRRRGYESQARVAVRDLVTAQEAYYVNYNGYKTSTNPGADFVNRGFTQGVNISILTTAFNTPGSETFTIKGRNTKCSSTSGEYTYDSSTSEIGPVGPCT